MSFEIDDLSRVVEVGAGLQSGGIIIYVREVTPDGYKVLAKSPVMTPEQARELAVSRDTGGR